MDKLNYRRKLKLENKILINYIEIDYLLKDNNIKLKIYKEFN